MSLRGFHLVFITFVTVLCIALAVWCFAFAPRTEGFGIKLFGAFSVAGAVLFPYYGLKFYHKAKHLVI